MSLRISRKLPCSIAIRFGCPDTNTDKKCDPPRISRACKQQSTCMPFASLTTRRSTASSSFSTPCRLSKWQLLIRSCVNASQASVYIAPAKNANFPRVPDRPLGREAAQTARERGAAGVEELEHALEEDGPVFGGDAANSKKQKQRIDEEPRGEPGNVVAGAERRGVCVEDGAVGGVVSLE